MKKIILITATIYSSLFSYAQESPSNNTKEVYCELVATGKMFSRKVSIEVDFGDQELSVWTNRQLKIRDAEGKIKNFNTLVDALNYMGSNGWKLLNAFPVTTSGGNVYHFYFKKELNALGEG